MITDQLDCVMASFNLSNIQASCLLLPLNSAQAFICEFYKCYSLNEFSTNSVIFLGTYLEAYLYNEGSSLICSICATHNLHHHLEGMTMYCIRPSCLMLYAGVTPFHVVLLSIPATNDYMLHLWSCFISVIEVFGVFLFCWLNLSFLKKAWALCLHWSLSSIPHMATCFPPQFCYCISKRRFTVQGCPKISDLKHADLYVLSNCACHLEERQPYNVSYNRYLLTVSCVFRGAYLQSESICKTHA